MQIAVLIWSGVLTYVLLKAVEFLLPLRVTSSTRSKISM